MEIKEQTYNKEIHDLILDVFNKYVASSYTEEGIKTFKNYIDEYYYLSFSTHFLAAYEENELVGVLGYEQEYITYFYVSTQGKGIGRALFEKYKETMSEDYVKVYASPYAYKIYEHLGFKKIEGPLTQDGITTTLMVYEKEI